MTGHRVSLRELLLAAAAGFAGLAATVPVSPADSAVQWDNLVLAAVALWATWRVTRLIRAMSAGARRPWLVLVPSGALFTVASVLTGTGLGGVFGGLGLGDVLLWLSVAGPIVCCAQLAGRTRATRWPVLALDGVLVTASLVVVADVLMLAPALRPGEVRPDLRPLVLGYGLYPAVAIGLAGALCTVTTRSARRSATAMIVMTAFLGLSSALLAVLIVAPSSAVLTVAADVSVVLAVVTGVLAVQLAPTGRTVASPAAAQPTVTPAGLGVTVVALIGVPATLLAALLLGLTVPPGAIAGCAAVIALLLARMLVRIRDSGRISEDLLRTEADFRGLVEASSDGVAIVDDELRLQFTSPAARALLGVDPEVDPHPLLLDLLVEGDRARVRHDLTRGGEVGPPLALRVAPPSGEPRDLEVTHHERPDGGRRVLHLRDATTRLRRQRELERMAFTDHLTGLPNRAVLFGEAARPADGGRCLLVLDLDGFKEVNDSAGHEAGDQLLVEVAHRLQGVVRAEDLVARLGGDEFAVLMSGDERDAVEAAQRVVDALSLPHRSGAWTFSVGASVGVATLGPGGGQLAFRRADEALRAAKQAGKGCLRVWQEDRSADVAAGGSLAHALVTGQVQLRYDVATNAAGTVASLHALPVWEHPTAGTLPAADVWAAAGREGCSADLQRWLLDRACAEVAGLAEPYVVAVDLPAGHLHAGPLAADVLGALAAARLAPSRLVLALTEEALLTGPPALPPALAEVRAAGVRLVLDDFGMGQTLFAHLARVQLDAVRIDVAALGARGDATRAARIVAAIVDNARSFAMRTVVHGVEPGPLRDAVLAAGVDVIRDRDHPRQVRLADVPALAAAVVAGADVLETAPAAPPAGSILAR
jgi:diguanylate cyclase (GGDEF)-like protein